MRRTTLRLLLLWVLLLPLSVGAAFAQEKKAEEGRGTGNVYRVDFAVHELEDRKRVNTRHYSLRLEADRRRLAGQIRASTKIPLPAGDAWQYMDVGLDLDCQLYEREDGLALDVTLEISNFVAPEGQGEGTKQPPILREIRSRVATVIQPGKPTVVSSVDDTATKRRYELEVTATKVN